MQIKYYFTLQTVHRVLYHKSALYRLHNTPGNFFLRQTGFCSICKVMFLLLCSPSIEPKQLLAVCVLFSFHFFSLQQMPLPNIFLPRYLPVPLTFHNLYLLCGMVLETQVLRPELTQVTSTFGCLHMGCLKLVTSWGWSFLFPWSSEKATGSHNF